MSHEVNTRLLEEAAEQIDRWEGTLYSKQIQFALELDDLDLLAVYVKVARDAGSDDWRAEATKSQEHFNSHDLLPKVDPEEINWEDGDVF